MRLLLVGVEQQFPASITRCLSTEGLSIDIALAEADAFKRLANDRFAAVVINLSISDGRGPIFIEQVRRLHGAMPILALTGQTAEERVRSLHTGADDCLASPFDDSEFSARIHALLRRANAGMGRTLRIGGLSLDLTSKEVFVKDRYFIFSARETAALEVLLGRANRVVSKKHLEMHLYGLSDENSPNATEVCVHRLRKRLLDARADVRIETVRGIGYILRQRKGA